MQGFPMDSHVTWTVDPDTGATMPEFDRAVTSEQLREYIKGVITNGVLPNPSNNLQVIAGTNGMTVLVNAGFCVIEGGLAIEPNTRTLEVTSADSTYDRIDTVVARWDSNDATRRVDLHIVKGVPASHPVRPTLTRNESIYELGLADVFVTKGIVTITNEKITDTRMESARCGICSSISEWDTTTIYQQVQADLKQFKSSEQTAFMEWFDQMKDQLTEDAAGHLQEEVDDINKKIHTNLLNPTLGTTIVNGVTVTNNEDGTFTLDGTATGWVILDGNCPVALKAGKPYRLTGCPSGGASGETNAYRIGLYNETSGNSLLVSDIGNGRTFTRDADVVADLHIIVAPSTTVEDLVFKPMLTTDLSATYDDYVQYSGDGELNQNVAEIFSTFFDIMHPIGDLFITKNASFNPNTATGWKGTWERDKGRFVRLAGDNDAIGSTGGSDNRTLSVANLPIHGHSLNGHTHSIPSLSGSTGTAGNHAHTTSWIGGEDRSFMAIGQGGSAYTVSNPFHSGTNYAGDHTHTVTTNASTTGGASGSTGNTGSGTSFDNRPLHENLYGWDRVS